MPVAAPHTLNAASISRMPWPGSFEQHPGAYRHFGSLIEQHSAQLQCSLSRPHVLALPPTPTFVISAARRAAAPEPVEKSLLRWILPPELSQPIRRRFPSQRGRAHSASLVRAARAGVRQKGRSHDRTITQATTLPPIVIGGELRGCLISANVHPSQCPPEYIYIYIDSLKRTAGKVSPTLRDDKVVSMWRACEQLLPHGLYYTLAPAPWPAPLPAPLLE